MMHVLWSLLYANWSMYPDLATGTTWIVKEGKRSSTTHQFTRTFCWPQKRRETRWNEDNQRLHQTARCTCKRSSVAWLPCFVEPTQLPFGHDQKPGWKANEGHVMRVAAHKWESHWNQKCQKWFFESWLSRSFRTFPTNRLLHFCTKAGPQSRPNCLSRLETREVFSKCCFRSCVIIRVYVGARLIPWSSNMPYLVHVLFKQYNLSNVDAQNQSLFKQCNLSSVKKSKSGNISKSGN